MSGDHPLRWIGGAAVAVGFFAVFASSAGESPRTLDLTVVVHQVSYAPTHSEAIAKTSQPVATPRLASRASQPRKVVERIGSAPLSPAAPFMTIAQTPSIAAMSSLSQTGGSLTRALKAHDRAAHREALPAFIRNTVARVDDHRNTVPPVIVALYAARPLRGPPAQS